MSQLPLFDETGSRSLAEARAEVFECRLCDLWKSGTRAVFGSGDPKARLLVLGEAPSETDLRSGEPFSGPSGGPLDEWLARLGLTRERVWLTNIVKHRPFVIERGREKNRPPRASESRACGVWLDIELRAVKPQVILALGGSAGKALLGKDFKISQDRGRLFPGPDGSSVLATYHPAYLLRLESPELETAEALVASDLDIVSRRLAELA